MVDFDDLLGHVPLEAIGGRRSSPEVPLWLELVWDGCWIAAAVQWFVWPARPRTAVGAAIALACLAAVAIPFTLVRRRYGNVVLDNPIARRVKARTAHEPGVSAERMAYLLGVLVVTGVLFAGLFGAAALVAPHVQPLRPFLGRHFY